MFDPDLYRITVISIRAYEGGCCYRVHLKAQFDFDARGPDTFKCDPLFEFEYFLKPPTCCVTGNRKRTIQEFHLPFFQISFFSQLYLFVRKKSCVTESVLTGALRHASGCKLKPKPNPNQPLRARNARGTDRIEELDERHIHSTPPHFENFG